MGVCIFFFYNTLGYVQISQPIMVYLKKKKNLFNDIFSIYIKQYYIYII